MVGRSLTSKEVLERTGISRATLNNYITLGILPRPVVAPGDGNTSEAPRIGHFPEAVLETIAQVDEMKKRGMKMAEIAQTLSAPGEPGKPPAPQAEVAPAPLPAGDGGQVAALRGPRYAPIRLDGPLRLTVENLDYPAYMVNRQFELEWCNRAAAGTIFGTDAERVTLLPLAR